MDKNTYCSYCSVKFAEQKLYPRICFYCGNTTYVNPLPVVVIMAVGNWIPEKLGIVIERRNIEPQKGGWALPSGYIDLGETWQQAAARELKEEINVVRQADEFKFWAVDQSINSNILIFCTIELNSGMWYKSAEWFQSNDEVQAIDMISEWDTPIYEKGKLFKSANAYDIRELVFPTHAKHVNAFFESESWNQQKKQNKLKL